MRFPIEQSETSDNRPYTNLLQNTTDDHENVLSETSANRDHENVLSETSANRPNINLFQDNTTDDEPVIITIHVPVSCISVKQRNLCNP